MNHPNIKQQITFFMTDKFDETVEFYQNILGLKLILDQGGCRIFQTSLTSFVGFCNRGLISLNRDIIFTLVTDEVDSWYEYLNNLGVKVENPPAHNPEYNIYHFFFRDPNGYRLEVQKFHDPDWLDVRS